MSGLRVKANVPGQKPVFRYKENGAYVIKDRKRGINWYRHQDEVLKPYLLPFICEYRQGENRRPDIVVIEDRAAAYKLDYSNELYIS